MCRKPIRLGMIILALGVSAGAALSNSAPLPVSASAQNSASPQNNGNASAQSSAPSQTKARPTPAQLDQLGAVVIAPPILRNAGTTFVPGDQPLFGALNLQGRALQGPLGEYPPAMQPAPNEAAIGSGGGEAGAPRQARD